MSTVDSRSQIRFYTDQLERHVLVRGYLSDFECVQRHSAHCSCIRMGQDPWWDRIQLAEQALASQTQKLLQPGDIAYAHGSLRSIFYKFVNSRGYTLTRLEEAWRVGVVHQERFCIVKRRLDDGRYEVYFLTTFAGTGTESIDPIGRYFGIPLDHKRHPPSSAALRLETTWLSDNPVFIFGIPVITDAAVSRMDNRRTRLSAGEIQRLNYISDMQVQRFHQVQGQLRKNYSTWRLTRRDHRPTGYNLARVQKQRTESKFIPRLRTILSFPTSRDCIDGRWLLRSLSNDILQRSNYLDSRLSSFTHPRPLPPPFYSSKLRASSAFLARLIH